MELNNLQLEFRDALTGDQAILPELLQPAANLVIHQNTIMQNLLQTLSNIYPYIMKLLGDDFFQQTARDYVQQYPSRSGNLNDYGEYFPHFLHDYPSLKNLPYLYEVALFEWQCHVLLSVASAPPFDLALLKNVNEQAYEQLIFLLHPAAKAMQFYFPLLRILDLCHGDQAEIDLDEKGVCLLLFRKEDKITVKTLDELDYLFLTALSANESLAQIVANNNAFADANLLSTTIKKWIDCAVIVGVMQVE